VTQSSPVISGVGDKPRRYMCRERSAARHG